MVPRWFPMVPGPQKWFPDGSQVVPRRFPMVPRPPPPVGRALGAPHGRRPRRALTPHPEGLRPPCLNPCSTPTAATGSAAPASAGPASTGATPTPRQSAHRWTTPRACAPSIGGDSHQRDDVGVAAAVLEQYGIDAPPSDEHSVGGSCRVDDSMCIAHIIAMSRAPLLARMVMSPVATLVAAAAAAAGRNARRLSSLRAAAQLCAPASQQSTSALCSPRHHAPGRSCRSCRSVAFAFLPLL